MHRSTSRLLAVIVLIVLGAPVALHFLMHDLHHHQYDQREHGLSLVALSHGNHEHPIVSSAPPQLPRSTHTTAAVVPAVDVLALRDTSHSARNVMAHGAIRLDEDVGLSVLLSTFLI